ncbi:FxSxx-COOH system tetratricopeptide repeat protein, partial [Streptomyces sp. NPDC059378]|uniref:FxSxx-COOH system tetratricopeptide repeat protein n=1 Tax=Streptomyces sp. NPDC059378 TaxID=3346815 RepID=UPI0036B16529
MDREEVEGGPGDHIDFRDGHFHGPVVGVQRNHQAAPVRVRPPAEMDAPAGLDDLPYRPGYFVGRSEEMDRLDAALNAPGVVLVQAVHGLGGIGKSTLAAHWAATRSHGRAPVRWITADSPAGVQQGLASLAVALQPDLDQTLTAEALAEYGLQWLACHTGWLLILDNVNDPADIAPLIARARGGRFLITSRLATAWTDVATLIRLDTFDPAESLALLSRTITVAGPRDLDGAAELCAELGHLPLAIEQVAAYLAQNPFTKPRAYLALLAAYPADMYRQGSVTTPAERTIARIWNITLDRITTLQPKAVDLLRTLAWYAPDNIPLTLTDGPAKLPARHAALGLLTAYNLVTPDPDTGTLSVHRLVQALARTPDIDDPHRTPTLIDQARQQATTNLHTALPADSNTPATWPVWRTLLPHIDALIQRTDQDTDTDTTADILNATGSFLNYQGLTARAISYFQRALAAYTRLLGADHPETLSSRNNLAGAYESAGDPARAITLYEQNLADTVRILGADHPNTLNSRNNLASAYESAGDLDRAITLHEQNLPDTVRILGADHPNTLTARNNLAYAYQSAGDLDRAITLHEQNLPDTVRILGADHPNTLGSRNNLANAYWSAGDLGRAITLHEQTLADRLRVLGADHPDTLSSRNNLASAYRSAGDLDRAITLHEQNLADRMRVLGADHPDTLSSRNNLANAYESAGDMNRAITLHEQNLADRMRVLGADHPDTLSSRNNLASAYESAGDLDRAITLHEQTLPDMVRVLGANHPYILTSRNNLANAYESAGDMNRAITLHEQNLADRMRV